MSKKSSKYSLDQIRAFRHEVSVLKKKGVIPKSVDARSVKPTRHYKEQVKKNQDVISGSAKAIKVSKTKAKEFKEAGYRVQNSRVVVSVKPGEKPSYSHGNVYLNRKLNNGEIQRIVLPRRYEEFVGWVDGDIRDPLLDTFKHKDEKFAFRFFGNNSIATYNSWDQLVRDLRERYNTVIDAQRKGDVRSQEQIVENIEIVRLKATKPNTFWSNDAEARGQKSRVERQRARRKWKREKNPNAKAVGKRGPDKAPRKKRTYVPPPPKSGLEIAEMKIRAAEASKRYRDKKKSK